MRGEKSFVEVVDVRKLPIGISDFKEIIEKSGFFVDKSMFIYEILENMSKVQLFTRPRRFGKTTNLMMLKEFFDIVKKEENKNLFNNLKISKTSYINSHRGKYPVIFITFKDEKQNTLEKSKKSIKHIISETYEKHSYLLKFLKGNKYSLFLDTLYEKDNVNYENAIKKLSQYLYEYWGEKVIILIDEYDTPIITSYIKDYYEEIIDFYRVFYGKTFKDNEYLEKAVITGINRIAKEGIFSGLNNIDINSILSNECENYFGFTEEEIKYMIIEYKLENNFENIKKWYDGYKINGISIYNTWSIINYLKYRKFGVYWINTSDNGEITKYLGEVAKKEEGNEIFKDLENLSKGETIITRINEKILFKNITTKTELWNLMLNAGYLTSLGEERGRYKLKIPNYEIQQYFRDAFIENFTIKNEKVYDIIGYILDGKIEMFSKELKKYILESSSYIVKNKEIFYQGFILGLFVILRDYYIANIEMETGYGRADLILESFNINDMSYIIEIKVVDDEKKLEQSSEEALKQIKKQKYYTNLVSKKFKNITLIGISFYNKYTSVKYEKINI